MSPPRAVIRLTRATFARARQLVWRRSGRLAFLVSSVGLALLGVDAMLNGALGLAGLLGLIAVWSSIATTGVFLPQWEMFGHVISHGPAGYGRVALTFDDGPHPVTTRKVLALLAQTAHRATFFVLGDKARKYPDVLREIVAAGHTIALHGDVHDRLHSFRMPGAVCTALRQAEETVTAVTARRPRYFRPPLGQTSPTTVRGVHEAGVTLVGWSARGLDGLRHQTPAGVLAHVERDLDDGAIVLLHDAAEHDDFEPASIAALPRLLALLEARNLISVGLDTLLDSGLQAQDFNPRPYDAIRMTPEGQAPSCPVGTLGGLSCAAGATREVEPP